MLSSSEFIKGYTKIIICSYLYKSRNYLYNIVKQIIKESNGVIKITNPSALLVIKQLEDEKLVTSKTEISEQNQARKYYELTEEGKKYYLDAKDDYIESLKILIRIIGGKKNE